MSSLKTIFRIYNGLKPGVLEHLLEKGAESEVNVWTLSRLSGTWFLNASREIQELAINKNASGSIASEDEFNKFCIELFVQEALKSLVNEKKLKKEELTQELIEEVCKNIRTIFVKWCTI